jgi:hypothetical protein
MNLEEHSDEGMSKQHENDSTGLATPRYNWPADKPCFFPAYRSRLREFDPETGFG